MFGIKLHETIELTAPKPTTRAGQLLRALKRAGRYGLFNYELNQIIGWRFGAAVFELRKEGYNIQRVQLSRGVHKYYLNKED